MKRFVEGSDRGQSTLFPECVADWIGEDNPVRVIDVFVEELDLAELGFGGVNPEVTGRPSYHPAVPDPLAIRMTRIDGGLRTAVFLCRNEVRQSYIRPVILYHGIIASIAA
jgi:hypothetical protein